MSLINQYNFLRWSDATPDPTDITNIAKGYVWDRNRCNNMPVLVSGEAMRFYINTDVTLTFPPNELPATEAVLNLTNALTGQVFTDVSPLQIHVFDTDSGAYTFYAQVVIDTTILPGIYYFTIADVNTNAIHYTSNLVQVVDSISNYRDYTTRCTFRHDRYFYGVPYHQLTDFFQQFRLILNEIDMQYESDKEVYNEVTTGKQRTYLNYKKKLKKVETYYFEDESHDAAEIMFDSAELLLNGKSFVQKQVYKITRDVNQKNNKGEIELYDQEFSSVNRCTTTPEPIIPPPPTCVAVAFQGTPVLPGMNVSEAYFYSFTLTGDLPYVIVPESIVKPDEMTLVPSGNTINLSGTYTGAATSLDVAFTVTNCDGANSVPFTGTIAVNHPVIAIQGAITFSCSDGGCSHQGTISLHVEFAEATPIPFNLLFGQVIQTGVGNKYTGNDIFTPPGGTTADSTYGAHNHLPFSTNAPAGTNIADFGLTIAIYQQGRDGDTASIWICHGCLFPIIDLYVKINNPGYSANFTITNGGVTIHNV